jgi:hypothetical protein
MPQILPNFIQKALIPGKKRHQNTKICNKKLKKPQIYENFGSNNREIVAFSPFFFWKKLIENEVNTRFQLDKKITKMTAACSKMAQFTSFFFHHQAREHVYRQKKKKNLL